MNDMTDSKVLQAAAGLYRNHASGLNRHTASGSLTPDDVRYLNAKADRLEALAAKLDSHVLVPREQLGDWSAALFGTQESGPYFVFEQIGEVLGAAQEPQSVQDFIRAPDAVREKLGEPVAKAAFKRQEESKEADDDNA